MSAKSEAVKVFERVSTSDRRRVVAKLNELLDEPRVSEEIRSAVADLTDAANAHNDGVAASAKSEWLSPNQAAAALNVSRPMVMKFLEEGRLTATKVGSHHRVLSSDVRALASERMSAAEAVRNARAAAHEARSQRVAVEMGLTDEDARAIGLFS